MWEEGGAEEEDERREVGGGEEGGEQVGEESMGVVSKLVRRFVRASVSGGDEGVSEEKDDRGWGAAEREWRSSRDAFGWT